MFDTMEGGHFLTSGAETCVFTPPVKCAQGPTPVGDFVSRIVENNDIETDNQKLAKKSISNAMEKGKGDPQVDKWLGGRPLSAYFNFAVGTCHPAFSPEDMVKEDGSPHECKLPIKLGKTEEVMNLLTPRQDADVRNMTHSSEDTIIELRKFIHAVILFNNEGTIHADAHFGNIAWMSDHIVLHDWGRLVEGSKGLKDYFYELELETREGRKGMIALGKHLQVIGPCKFMNACPIMDDPVLMEKFVKVYDTISLMSTVAKIKKVGPVLVNKYFVFPMKALLLSAATPEEVSLKTHDMIDILFDEADKQIRESLNLVIPVIPPPAPDVSVLPPPAIKRARMTGGYFLAKGADTCVYDPPVKCIRGTQEGEIPPGEYVSRIVPAIKDEWEAQQIVKEKIESFAPVIANNRLARVYLGDRPLTAYFNFASAVCQPNFTGADLIDKNGNPKACGKYNQIGPENRAQNLITPKQGIDLVDTKELTPAIVDELRKYFHAVLFLNSMDVAHMDAHFGNVAWMGDHLVMHDWGRIVIDLYEFKGDLLKYRMDNPEVRQGMIERGKYLQFVTPCAVLETCPTLMSGDEQLSRFMKVYDLLSMISSLSALRVGEGEADFLKRKLVAPIEELLQGFATSVEVSVKAHEIVETFFQELKKDGEDMAALEEMIRALTPIAAPDITPPESIVSPPQIARAVPRPPVRQGTPMAFGDISLFGGNRRKTYRVHLGGFTKINPIYKRTVRKKPMLNQTDRFCKCIKKVRKTFKNEKGPIAVCVKSVLWKRNRTLKRFKCGKHGRVVTQPRK